MSLDWVLILVSLLLMLVCFPLGHFYRRRGQWYGQQAADLRALRYRLERGELSPDQALRQFQEIRARRFVWRFR
jgi:hypothetical protein